jgi:hypothetical protein
MIMTLLRRWLTRLLGLLHRMKRPVQAQPVITHISISSFQRRYPGRTPASELRRNLGWIAATANRPHRDRRA